MTEDEEPTGSLFLGQFSLERKDLPFREDTKEPINYAVYQSRRSPHLFVYHSENDHWNRFVETSL